MLQMPRDPKQDQVITQVNDYNLQNQSFGLKIFIKPGDQGTPGTEVLNEILGRFTLQLHIWVQTHWHNFDLDSPKRVDNSADAFATLACMAYAASWEISIQDSDDPEECRLHLRALLAQDSAILADFM